MRRDTRLFPTSTKPRSSHPPVPTPSDVSFLPLSLNSKSTTLWIIRIITFSSFSQNLVFRG